MTKESTELDSSRMVKLQINVMKTQMTLEDVLTDIAGDFYPDDRVVILCDRGVMDGAVSLPKHMWQALLDETGTSNTQLRDKRYDLVLHLVTAVDGAEEFYAKDDKESRYADAEEALRVDRRTQLSWVGHPSYW